MLKLWQYFLFFFICLVVALVATMPIQAVLPHVKLPNTVNGDWTEWRLVNSGQLLPLGWR